MAHNRARTGNPWLEKLFTENALFFCVRTGNPWLEKLFTENAPFLLCHGTPLKRTGAKLRENPRQWRILISILDPIHEGLSFGIFCVYLEGDGGDDDDDDDGGGRILGQGQPTHPTRPGIKYPVRETPHFDNYTYFTFVCFFLFCLLF